MDPYDFDPEAKHEKTWANADVKDTDWDWESKDDIFEQIYLFKEYKFIYKFLK